MERAQNIPAREIPKGVRAQRRRQVVEGHKDKQGKCHCNYDQTCTAMVCGSCNRMVSHAMIFVREVDEEATKAWKGEPWKTFYLYVGYKSCTCGAKDWLYGCEGRAVEMTN